MRGTVRLRDAIADHATESSLAARVRAARWALLLRRFPEFEQMRVLDLGGTVDAWRSAPVLPRHVTLVNVAPEPKPVDDQRFTPIGGDACDPPSSLWEHEYDFVYSNSAIEHVGGHARRSGFAQVARTAAPHHWIQTPYRYFPLEPHWLFPGFQFLPVQARCAISRRWRLGWYSRPGDTSASLVEGVLEIELLSATEMRHYFPDSELVRERWLRLTKSLIAASR